MFRDLTAWPTKVPLHLKRWCVSIAKVVRARKRKKKFVNLFSCEMRFLGAVTYFLPLQVASARSVPHSVVPEWEN